VLSLLHWQRNTQPKYYPLALFNNKVACIKVVISKMTAEKKHRESPVATSKVMVTETTKVKTVVTRTVVKKRQGGDFWINAGVMLFISICLLVLGWEVLLKIA